MGNGDRIGELGQSWAGTPVAALLLSAQGVILFFTGCSVPEPAGNTAAWRASQRSPGSKLLTVVSVLFQFRPRGNLAGWKGP